MKNNIEKIIYLVTSDTDDNNVRATFESKEEAIKYAKDSDDAIVYEITLDENEEEINEEAIRNYL